MLVPMLIIIIVILAVHVPKNNAKTIIMKEFKPLFEKRLEDPLLPPERTYPSNRINIRTQGPEQPYQQIGFLFNQGTNSRFPLFGKIDYGDVWKYYVQTTSEEGNIKIPLDQKKELYSGDIVQVPSYNGDYISEIYEIDSYNLKYL